MNRRKKSKKLKFVITLTLICSLAFQGTFVYARDDSNEVLRDGRAGTLRETDSEKPAGAAGAENVLGSDGIENLPGTAYPLHPEKDDGSENGEAAGDASAGKENGSGGNGFGEESGGDELSQSAEREESAESISSKDGKTISDAGERRDISLSFSASVQSAPSESGVSIRVYKGAFTEKEAPKRYGAYHLDQAEAGDVFTYRLYAEGCYIYYRTDVVTEEDIRTGQKNISYTLDRRAGEGYEAKTVYRWPEVFEEKLFDAGGLTGVDRSLLDTPAFNAEKAAHQFTSIEEGCDYLRNLCNESSRAYLYYLEENSLCPVVILTGQNLDGADTLDQAIVKLSKDKKMKVMYQAQIHGNEPASGEGALAVCRGLSQNPELLSKMDIVVIPYVNTKGSKNFTRSNGSGININRDALQLLSEEAKNLHRLFNKLMPEVFIDGHEFIGKNTVSEENGKYVVEGMEDVKVACIENLNRGEKLFPIERRIAENLVNGLSQKGFRTFYYPANWDSTTSCNYARMQNCLAFLIESNGIGNGKLGLERRVLAQYESVLSILTQAAAKKSTVVSAVKKARNDLVQEGKRYYKSRRFVLSHEADGKEAESKVRPIYDFFGQSVDESRVYYSYNRARSVKSRSKPTAYIISKSSSGAEEVRRVLSANGAEYFELKAKTKLSVTQYTGNSSRAKVTKRKTVSFPKGAYVFCMDQTAANIIAASFEPDAADSAEYEGSFVQSGVVRKFKSGYPIYRYSGRNPQESLAKYRKKK